MVENLNTMKNNYFSKKMSITSIRIVLMAIMLFASATFNNLFAQVIITAPSLTVTATCQFPTPYSALGNIVITESAPSDFAIQSNKTLILIAPTNFSFLPGTGLVTHTGTNITTATLTTVTANKITVTFTVTGVGVIDALTISGIMVRGNTNIAGPSSLKRDAPGGTATINNDVAGTVHGTFTSVARDPVILVQPNPKSICEGGNTSFSVSTVVAPVSYEWQEDQGGGFVALVNGATYSGVSTALVNITGAPSSMSGFQYRCKVIGTQDICFSNPASLSVNPPPAITSDPTDTAVCAGSNASFSVLATGSGLTYTWFRSTNGGVNFFPFAIVSPYSIIANSLFITTTPASFNGYQYHCIVSDGNTCGPDVQSTNPGILTVNPKPIVLTVKDTVCFPGTFDLTLAGVTAGSTPIPPGLTFSYYTDPGAITVYPTPTTAAGGTYYIVGVTALGCSDTTALIETVNPKPVVNTSAPAQVCFPAKVNLTLPGVAATVPGTTPGLNFTYFTDAAATTHIPDSSKVAVGGTYYIVGTIPATGCSDTTAVVVTINPKPVVSTVSQAVCAPATVDLTAPGVSSSTIVGTTYNYYTDAAATFLYPTPTTALSNTYFSVGTVPGTFCSDTTSVLVTINPKPTLVTHDPAAVCGPSKVNITLPADTLGSTANLDLTYFTDAAATLPYLTPTAADSGTYYIVGEILATGCTDTTAINVTVYPKPTVNTINPAAVCSPLTINLTLPGVIAPSTTPGLTYSYFTDAGANTPITDASAVAITGTYYIVGDFPATGCSDTTAVVVTVNSKPTVVTHDPAPICTPSTLDLTLPAVTVPGTTPGLNFTYFTDAAATIHMTDSSKVAVSGIYYIVGVIGGGCSDTTAVTVTVNQKPDVFTTNPAAACAPATVDLTLPAVTTTSTPGLTFFYYTDPGATSFYFTPATATAGTYGIVGVIVGTGCSDTAAVTVTVNPKPVLVTHAPAAVCAPEKVDITLPADTTGSTAGLTLSYFTDAAATIGYPTPTAADSGTYYIVGVLPATGCSDTTAILVTVNPKPILITVPQAACLPSTVDLTLSGVTAGSPSGLTFTYFTNPGATTHMSDSTKASAGTYYIVGVTLAGCADTAAVAVTVSPKPILVTHNPAPECSPTKVNITLPADTTGSTADLTLTYFTDAAATIGYPTPTTADSGTYYIVGTIAATGCTDTTAITVTIYPKPTVVVTNPSPVCSPEIVNLTLPAVTAGSTPGLSLTYYTDAAATTHIADSSNIVVGGTYYIVGIVPATGCSDTTAVFVSIDVLAVGGSVNTDAFVCNGANGDTLRLTGSSGTILKWQYSIDFGTTWIDTANTTNKQYYSNITTTTWYRAFLTEFCANAISIEARITVDSSPMPIGGIVSANDTVCSGSNHDTLTLAGYSGNVTRWEYSIDGGTNWVYINDTTASLIYNNLTTTTIYHAIVQNSICNFATSSNDTITVTPVSVAGAIGGALPACAYNNGGTLTLTGYTGTVVKWQYSIDAGITWIDSANTTATQAYSNLLDTTLYRAIVKSGVCFNDTSDAVAVNVYPKPVALFTADTVCLGAVTTFINSSSISSGFIQFNQWDFGDNSSSSLLNPTHIYSQAGANTVSLITTSNLGCLDTATLGILVDPLPDAQIISNGPLSFCCGGSVTLSALSGMNYLWSTFATTQSIVVNNCLSSGIYALTITDPITLCPNSSSVTITISPVPVANAGNDTTISLGSSFTLNGQGGTAYSWSPATGLNNPNISSPLANPLVTTIYELTVTTIFGCSDIDSITISVITDYNLTVTNLMTANGDGYNDKWIVKNIENYPGTEVIVVNREGQQVFFSSSYDNSWDGHYKNGNALPDGTYYYFIKFKDSNKIYKGPLTILNEK